MDIDYKTENLLEKVCRTQPYNYFKKENKLTMKRIIKNYKGRNVEFDFPIYIKINPSTAGLIVGEGYIDERQFVFANSNEKAIKSVLEFLSQFNINNIKFTLELSIKNMKNDFIEKSRTKWENIIHDRITKIRLRKEFNNTTEKGTLHLRYHNSCFAKVLKVIIEDAKRKAESNKNIAKEYIKGVLAAEGNINVKKKTRCLYLVRISAKKKRERVHYKKCLKKIGIKIYCKDMPTVNKCDPRTLTWKTKKGRGGAVLINRWMNFYKILSIGLLDLHKDKKEKFIKHFLYNKTTKWLLEFKNLPEKWFTAKDFKEEFDLARQPSDRIKKMLELKFLKQKRIKSVNKYPRYKYHLMGKYFQFINKLLNNAPFIKS